MDFWTQATFNTLIIVVGVVTITSMVALPLAWITERSDIIGAGIFKKIFTLPYVVPSYLLAVSWITLANPRVGWINLLFSKIGFESLAINVYGLLGIVLIESSALFSILYLTMVASFKSLDPALEESARLSGASPFKVFRFISMPILKNSILLGVLTVGLASFASFGVPAMIGAPARRFVLTTGVYSLIHQGNLEAYSAAMSVALKMAIFSILVVVLMKFFSNKKTGFGGSRVSRPALVALGSARIPLTISLGVFWSLTIALPLLTLVFSSFQQDPSSFSLSNFGLQAWKKVFFFLPGFSLAFKNSLITSSIAAIMTISFATFLAILRWNALQKRNQAQRLLCRIIEETAFILYSLPGTVLALLLIALNSAWSNYMGYSFSLSNTLSLIVIAFTLKYLSLAITTIQPNAQQIHSSLIESAQLSGAKHWQRFVYIWLPLLKPSIISALLLVLMPCLSELTITILIYGPKTHNLGVLLFEQQEYADRASASVIGTLILVFVMIFQFILGRLQREY